MGVRNAHPSVGKHDGVWRYAVKQSIPDEERGRFAPSPINLQIKEISIDKFVATHYNKIVATKVVKQCQL